MSKELIGLAASTALLIVLIVKTVKNRRAENKKATDRMKQKYELAARIANEIVKQQDLSVNEGLEILEYAERMLTCWLDNLSVCDLAEISVQKGKAIIDNAGKGSDGGDY